MTEQELYDGLKRIAEAQEATMRQCRIMVAGFKATGERDIRYMDGFMDGLLDFMDQGSDTEQLYRDYLTYISSFNPEEGKRRFLDLEDSLGYWTPAVIAAGMVTREVHQGQKDKGGNDYFVSHLLPVAQSGFTWKEKIVGFLHDAIEDTDYTTEALFMDNSRIPSPTQKDYERLERYKSEYKVLLDMLPPIDLSVNLE